MSLRLTIASKLLAWVLGVDSDLVCSSAPVGAEINKRAILLAQQMLMDYLDREGFLHCAFCPKRTPLRNINGTRCCPKHEGLGLARARGTASTQLANNHA